MIMHKLTGKNDDFAPIISIQGIDKIKERLHILRSFISLSRFILGNDMTNTILRHLDDIIEELDNVWGHLETDHLLLEHAVETATDFLTIDEFIADYEEH